MKIDLTRRELTMLTAVGIQNTLLSYPGDDELGYGDWTREEMQELIDKLEAPL